jgi:hypothetical protein
LSASFARYRRAIEPAPDPERLTGQEATLAFAIRAIRRLARELGYDLARAFAPGADCIDLMVRLRERMRRGGGDIAPFLQFCLEHLTESRSDCCRICGCCMKHRACAAACSSSSARPTA